MDLAVFGRRLWNALFFGLFAWYASDDLERYGLVLIAAVLNRCQPGMHIGSCSYRHRISALIAYGRAAHNPQHVVERGLASCSGLYGDIPGALGLRTYLTACAAPSASSRHRD
jgi:hypothetical protein